MNDSLNNCGNGEIGILTEPLILFFLQLNSGFHTSTFPAHHIAYGIKLKPFNSPAFKTFHPFPILCLQGSPVQPIPNVDIPEYTLDEILNSVLEYLFYFLMPACLYICFSLCLEYPSSHGLPLIFQTSTHLFKETSSSPPTHLFFLPSPALGIRLCHSLGHRAPQARVFKCLLNKYINEPLTKTRSLKGKKSCSSSTSRLCCCLSLQTPTHVQKCCLLPLYLIHILAENKILESHFLSLLTL